VWEVVVNLIVVFTKYDTLVTEIIYEGDLDESTEQGWQNAEREADSVFEEWCVGPFTKAIDEVLNKKVPNANLSVPIKKVSGRLFSSFDISCTDDDGSLRYPQVNRDSTVIRATDKEIQQQTYAPPQYRTTLLKRCHCSTSEH
jgi:hypothetical protein